MCKGFINKYGGGGGGGGGSWTSYFSFTLYSWFPHIPKLLPPFCAFSIAKLHYTMLWIYFLFSLFLGCPDFRPSSPASCRLSNPYPLYHFGRKDSKQEAPGSKTLQVSKKLTETWWYIFLSHEPSLMALLLQVYYSSVGIWTSNREVKGPTPVGRTQNFFASMPVSLTEETPLSFPSNC